MPYAAVCVSQTALLLLTREDASEVKRILLTPIFLKILN